MPGFIFKITSKTTFTYDTHVSPNPESRDFYQGIYLPYYSTESAESYYDGKSNFLPTEVPCYIARTPYGYNYRTTKQDYQGHKIVWDLNPRYQHLIDQRALEETNRLLKTDRIKNEHTKLKKAKKKGERQRLSRQRKKQERLGESGPGVGVRKSITLRVARSSDG